MDIRTLIDTAASQDAANFRDQLYANIQARVEDHLENEKKRIASTMFKEPQSTEPEVTGNEENA